MRNDFLKELYHAFWRTVAGRQDSSNKRKFASVIVLIVIFFASFFVNHKITDILTPYKTNVVLQPYEIDNNLSVPIDIVNGPKPLTNIKLYVKTCQMAKTAEFEVPDLIEWQDYRIKLKDEGTVLALNLLFNSEGFSCDVKNVSAKVQCWTQSYTVNGKLYVPPQECKRHRCGTCDYEIQLKSDKYSENFTSSFLGAVPIETYKIKIIPQKILDVKKEDMIPFSPVGMSIFSPFDICMFETNYSFDECKIYPIERIYSDPINFTLVPKNQSLGNFSVTITQEINEIMKQRISSGNVKLRVP